MHEARHARLAARLQQVVRAIDVGAHEGRRVFDAAIDVALGGKVNHRIAAAHLLEHAAIADVHLHELAAAFAQLRLKVLQIAGIGELVEDDQLPVRMLGDRLMNEVGADESRAARDQ